MLIENPDAFKSWLTSVLEPLCDADPAALAKYVYALVKKDKPLDELRMGMVDQLDVFLQGETKSFVELLFKSLESQEYLKPSLITEHAENPPSSPGAAEKMPRVTVDTHEHNNISSKNTYSETTLRDDKSDLPSIRNERKEALIIKEKDPDNRSRHSDNAKKDIGKHRIVLNRTTKFVPATVPKEKPAYATEQTLVKVIPDLLEDSMNEQLPIRNKRDRKSDSDKEERRRRGYKSRSRSRSWDRTRRPPIGTRPLWRNRSPPSQQNRYERRRSRSGSPVRVPRYRNRSPPPGSELEIPNNRSRSRSRERLLSPVPNNNRDRLDRVSRERERDRQSRNRDRIDRDKVDRDRLDRDRDRERDDRGARGHDAVSGTATPTQDSNPGDSSTQPRGTTTLAGIFAPTQKKRCRDFDEKGYCMRGDLCQFDHGADPLVLEEALSHVLALPMTRPPPRLPAPGVSEYNPLAPDIWARGGGPGYMHATPPPPFFPYLNAPPHTHHPVAQRELIPIPTNSTENMPPNNTSVIPPNNNIPLRAPLLTGAPLAPVTTMNNHTVPPPSHPMKKKPFDYNRLGPNRHHSTKSIGNCSLELKKVPRGLNDISHLNNHFSKFGKIVNIQVNYEDDPEAALITFSNHTEANVAYKSTEAVLNNRFIKVFWHNSELQSKQENVPPGQRPPVKDRLSSGVNNHTHVNNNNHMSYNKVLINKENVKIANNIPTEVKKPLKPELPNASESSKNGEEDLSGTNKEQINTSVPETPAKPEVTPSAKLAAMVRKRGEGAAKLVRDLKRRSQKLLENQLQQQKMLLQRLESGTITECQRESLLVTIKANQKSIEKTKKDLVSNPKLTMAQPEDIYVTNFMKKMSISSNTTKGQTAKKAAFGNLRKLPRSKEEAQKEILDAELDLFTKQQEGQDVTELQKRVAELKRHVLKATIPVRRGSVNRLSPRGRFSKTAVGGKSAMFVNQSVDHRPRSFMVSGYEADELDQLLLHFTQYGEIVEKSVDLTTPSLWLQFKSRKIAEQAATKGKQFNDRTLTVTWQPKAVVPVAPQTQAEKNSTAEGDVLPTESAEPSNEPPKSPSYLPPMNMHSSCVPSPSYSPNSPGRIDMPFYESDVYFVDSEEDEGKDYDKEEKRPWRR